LENPASSNLTYELLVQRVKKGMRIRELITQLEQLEKEHGNIPVGSFVKSGNSTLAVELAEFDIDPEDVKDTDIPASQGQDVDVFGSIKKVFLGPEAYLDAAQLNWTIDDDEIGPGGIAAQMS